MDVYQGFVGIVKYLLLIRSCLYASKYLILLFAIFIFDSFSFQPTLLFHVTSYNICSPMRHLFHCLGITCVPNGCISCRMVDIMFWHSQILLVHRFERSHGSNFMCISQVPVAPLQRANAPPSPNNIQWNQSQRVFDNPPEQGIPTIITWNQGGNDVAVEGSWDNWRSRYKVASFLGDFLSSFPYIC